MKSSNLLTQEPGTPAKPLPPPSSAGGVEFDDDTKPQQATPKANTRVLPVHIEKIEMK